MSTLDTDPRTISLVLARARVVFGLAALALPGVVGRIVLGTSVKSSFGGSRALVRMVGVRDIALGVGAITNLKEEKEDAEWVSMGALADGGDAIALVLAPIGWRRVANALFAATAAVTGLMCSRQLADQRVANERAAIEAASTVVSAP